MKKRTIALLCGITLMLSLCMGIFAGCNKEPEPVVTTPLLRIGILSDIHVSQVTWGDQQHERFEKALLFFKNKGVDGVLIAGDLQENMDYDTAVTNIEEVVDIWFKVFPDNINDLTGERVEPMFIYGNHDKGLVDAEYWPERLGTFEEAWIKEIKGYQFVGAHYTKEWSDLAANYASRAEVLSEGKPFFFTQHQPIKGTLFGCNEGLLGTGAPMLDVLKKYENCVVFSGHTHIPITDERSIWQSNSKKAPQFTAVNCATINYGWLKGDVGSYNVTGDSDDTQQGMYMIVDGAQVTLERYSFANMEIQYNADGTNSVDMEKVASLGAPWIFDATQKKDRPYDYDDRQELASQPVFEEGAQLEVGSIGDTYVNLFIPPVTVTAPEGFSDIVQSYLVEAVDPETEEVVATAEVASEYHVDISPERLYRDMYIGIEGLEPGKTYIIKAYARECYQKLSEPLTVEITTLTENAPSA